jgi:hypothetical protein
VVNNRDAWLIKGGVDVFLYKLGAIKKAGNIGADVQSGKME